MYEIYTDTDTDTHTDVLSFSSSIYNPVLSLCLGEKKNQTTTPSVLNHSFLSYHPPPHPILSRPYPLPFSSNHSPPFCLIWAVMEGCGP